MPMLVAGLLLVWLSSFLLRGFMRGDPAAMARVLRKSGGSLALLVAAFLVLRGEINLALLAGGAGLWLLGTPSARPAWSLHGGAFSSRRGGAARTPVRILTDGLDVVVDPVRGTVRGRCTAGPAAGRDVGSLSAAEVAAVHAWSLSADPEGARLLEAYLDRRFPGWRETAHGDHHAGRAQPRNGARRPLGMSDEEAHHVLGLAQGASREEIATAHRRLMKQHHPDHGGSTLTAARVNEAKDVLMRRHP